MPHVPIVRVEKCAIGSKVHVEKCAKCLKVRVKKCAKCLKVRVKKCTFASVYAIQGKERICFTAI